MDQWLSHKLGVDRYAMVAEVANDSGWHFRRCRDPNLQQILRTISSMQAPVDESVEDKVLWRSVTDLYNCRFSTSRTWEQIRVHTEKRKWSKVIWFGQGVPRFMSG